MRLLDRRRLLWVAIIFALGFPLVAQANGFSIPVAAPAYGPCLAMQKCQMAGCSHACCQQAGHQGRMSGCPCFSGSMPCLPALGAKVPVPDESFNCLVFIAPLPEVIVFDIFRPPQA